ncbi:hypothetical protein [Tsukamurella pseudospumae]|uniref:Uncharacterized protein n=1 Tax=Tsukamurella pseudospumae TaxID=239498 RepID=A0A138AK45_9ACTN|nr:hypothetical protein [Tsukamurella pseudospumae]KXP10749.1 hypothetical protein AXK60_24885 [Tsukamurella pseudospumae]
MARRTRNIPTERRELTAAADRLLAGTPLRSTSGKLTVTELIHESGVRRDVVYRDHRDICDQFTARSKGQHHTPTAHTRIADANRKLRSENSSLKIQLAAEREQIRTLMKVASELDLELDQTREKLSAHQQIDRLPNRQKR